MHDSMEKLIKYNQLEGGFCNVLLSLEMILALGYITKRKIILGDVFHYGLDERNKSKPESIWDILDKNTLKKEFSIVENYDGKLTPRLTFEPSICYYDSSSITDENDFLLFGMNRYCIDCNFEDYAISVPTTIGSFFYNVYPGSKENRNALKKKINNALVYKQKYIDIAEKLIKNRFVNFNAVHVRYPWFTQGDWADVVNIQNSPKKLLDQLVILFDRDFPLYVATDLKKTSVQYNRDIDEEEYIGPLRKYFKKIILLKDFNKNFTFSEEIAMDQLICTMASKFYGTYYSTFSKRINIMRGIQGKETHDYMGWNKIKRPGQEIDSPFPWNNFSGEWPWHYSSYLQYRYE